MSEYSIKRQMDILRHTLGADERYDRSQWGFRNRYLAGEPDFPLLDFMVENGLLWKNEKSLCTDAAKYKEFYYHATELGCQCLGFTREQIKRALES